MAKVYLDPERAARGVEQIGIIGQNPTLREMLIDPGKTAESWELLRWVVTGKREFCDDAEKRIDDLIERMV